MFTHVTLRACSLALFSAELKVAIISQPRKISIK